MVRNSIVVEQIRSYYENDFTFYIIDLGQMFQSNIMYENFKYFLVIKHEKLNWIVITGRRGCSMSVGL